MLTIKINDTEKTVPNQANELTIPQFESICQLSMLPTDDYIERYITIFEILGITPDETEQIDTEDFMNAIKQFNLTKWDYSNFVPEIKIGDKIYRAFTGDKYVLSVPDLSKIEHFIKKNPKVYLAEMLAIIYKDIELDKKTNRQDDVIITRAKLFREELKAEVMLPYVTLILNKVVTQLNNGLAQ